MANSHEFEPLIFKARGSNPRAMACPNQDCKGKQGGPKEGGLNIGQHEGWSM